MAFKHHTAQSQLNNGLSPHPRIEQEKVDMITQANDEAIDVFAEPPLESDTPSVKKVECFSHVLYHSSTSERLLLYVLAASVCPAVFGYALDQSITSQFTVIARIFLRRPRRNKRRRHCGFEHSTYDLSLCMPGRYPTQIPTHCTNESKHYYLGKQGDAVTNKGVDGQLVEVEQRVQVNGKSGLWVRISIKKRFEALAARVILLGSTIRRRSVRIWRSVVNVDVLSNICASPQNTVGSRDVNMLQMTPDLAVTCFQNLGIRPVY